ncbi:IS630 transposase-related protein [[Leptolyngbya] sp. PCC 7376]|uniref:IS630 transposase-related protein n=1 Tax=[Leptolyngbya] sp. PCC 7376 TaxID=111781 RepID=UPI0009FC4A65
MDSLQLPRYGLSPFLSLSRTHVLVDRAQYFGVKISSMHYALKQMKITRKKRAKVS